MYRLITVFQRNVPKLLRNPNKGGIVPRRLIPSNSSWLAHLITLAQWSTVGGMQWNGIALLRVTGEVCYTLSVHCFLIQGLIQFPTAACAGTSGAGVSPPSVRLIAAGSPRPADTNRSRWLLVRPCCSSLQRKLYLPQCFQRMVRGLLLPQLKLDTCQQCCRAGWPGFPPLTRSWPHFLLYLSWKCLIT